jgi:hypothetical protein
MEWVSIIVSIICILGVGIMLVKIWNRKNGKVDNFWEKDRNYDAWGDPEGLEPVDDWDKKKELD